MQPPFLQLTPDLVQHFSHPHNLIMHQLPETIEVNCSGCNSSCTQTVFVCWQCNFFLHEQCYRATRSLKHPLHPLHPLSLIPFPTYPSNSFYCNSCNIIGTGFSYSCANCEFDLHVQCAYSISMAAASFQNSHQFQELVPPTWNEHNSVVDHNAVPLFSYEPLNSISDRYHSSSLDLPYDSVHQNSIPMTAQDSSMAAQNLDDSHNSIPSVQYPSIDAIPTSLIPTAHDSILQNEPSISVPTSSQKPPNISQNPSMAQSEPSVFIPTAPSNPIPSTQDSSTSQTKPSVTQNESKDNKIMHFSHPHNLTAIDLKEDEENEVTCSGCEDTVIGKGYSCVEPTCDFHLHESCFQLKKVLDHKSHPEHQLTLLALAPYNNKNGEFTCNACFSDGTGFCYHCSVCKFDLHIQCVSLPETMKRSDHEHLLKLFYSCPVKNEDYTFSCDVCHGEVQKDRWVYYCESCDYGTHLGCVDCDECEADSINDAEAQLNSVMDARAQLERLQLQMQMARQQAQLMASMGASLANLV
ncbi:uncharacterized protein [Rutidosis leptorrhynchoides]|uniref:uncharacterized protein n=1 Tax=Rutidosis leptorrhynchoides TaxID=125765 RepID=UPI003A99D744